MDEKTIARFRAKVDVRGPDECWPWSAGTDAYGYGAFWLRRGKNAGAHRVAFFLEHGRWPEPCCLHSCDTPPCCNPRHLFEGTNDANMEDMARKRRTGNLKLTEEQVREIRSLRGVEKQIDIAARMGVSQTLVSLVQRGKAGRHVTPRRCVAPGATDPCRNRGAV